MTDAAKIARGLTKAQREALLAWKWKSWVAIRSDITPLIPTGLLDIRRFPLRIYGTRKAMLNGEGLAVRAELERIADE